jgi:sporadic carbohydrate cluster 2OG-Fe(II) oxygenase
VRTSRYCPRADLDRIRDLIADIAASYLKLPPAEDKGVFLDGIHEKVDVHKLNDLRLAVIREMNEEPWTRLAYFNTARRALEVLVGNELAMQLRINLSIQLPSDDSSLLPVHADVWSGDSPYEVVLWVPYVHVYGTKTMYILPRERDSAYQARLRELKLKSAEELYRLIEPELRWLDIPYGHVLLFTQNVMHGNVVNRETETRWSSNCRFKSVFSPYHDKKLGEFFEPILVRPATSIGASYRLPSVT